MRFVGIVLLLILAAGAAFAGYDKVEDCPVFNGNCVAGPNTDEPGLGAWRYEMSINWDTGRNGVSHIDLIVDNGENCSEADLEAGLDFATVAGQAAGEPSCTVDFWADIEPNGDPSIPGVIEPIIKYEYADGGCELGSNGTAVLVFYSDYPPYPIQEDNLFLVEKHANRNCRGELTGEFPGLPCAPVTNENETFSGLKVRYGN
jgi:hypothetical protein